MGETELLGYSEAGASPPLCCSVRRVVRFSMMASSCLRSCNGLFPLLRNLLANHRQLFFSGLARLFCGLAGFAFPGNHGVAQVSRFTEQQTRCCLSHARPDIQREVRWMLEVAGAPRQLAHAPQPIAVVRPRVPLRRLDAPFLRPRGLCVPW